MKERYGYDHPPRDVRENGIPIETFRVTGGDGRKIAAYRFGELGKGELRRMEGRTGLSKIIKDALIAKYGCRCFIYLEDLPERDLRSIIACLTKLRVMAANRAKSWSCEHCENWKNLKKREVCLTCYWASPENYGHIAMRQVRRLDLIWQGDEVATFERLKQQAHNLAVEIPAFVKRIIEAALARQK